MRNICEVITRMLEHAEGEALRGQLTRLRQDAAYTAPEDQGSHWSSGQMCMFRNIKPDDCTPGSWEQKVVDIWTGRDPGLTQEEQQCQC